jgi:predicted nucleic acid-binding protein
VIVVADSGPLRYLIVLKQQALLAELFGEVWIPLIVLRELTNSSTPAVVRDLLSNGPGWLFVKEPTPEGVSAINPRLDAGERAALALAKEERANLVLIDDAEGRREALTLGLRLTGALGVLRLGVERGPVDVPAVVHDLLGVDCIWTKT